ncbi:hypothetical protein WR25_18166 [Diploscapter pachys]|uniref:Methyltransferase domain-containing protein n=1 Tax=Diploscapter pachys TaxID=2018661 RepID=A0A2A2JHR6_9BILA|nr:hypothetical protein WR25_18166 [Diploscapter pachys]
MSAGSSLSTWLVVMNRILSSAEATPSIAFSRPENVTLKGQRIRNAETDEPYTVAEMTGQSRDVAGFASAGRTVEQSLTISSEMSPSKTTDSIARLRLGTPNRSHCGPTAWLCVSCIQLMTSRASLSFWKSATEDLAAQYALPIKSIGAGVFTRMNAAKMRFLNEAVVENLQIQPDDYALEIGYGRGNALRMVYEKIKGGKGMAYGIEASAYMEDVTKNKFLLEINEQMKIQLDKTSDLRNLPYPTSTFDHIFHVDVFYFLHRKRLPAICHEFRRILKPGKRILCGMQISRLKELTEKKILNEGQWDPLNYLIGLEQAEFTGITMSYHNHPTQGEYQLIEAVKPADIEAETTAELVYENLKKEVAKDMIIKQMMESGKTPTNEDIDALNDLKTSDFDKGRNKE